MRSGQSRLFDIFEKVKIKSGVVFQPGEEKKPVKVAVMIVALRMIALILSWSGLGLILTAFVGLIFVYIPLGAAEAKYALSKTQLAVIVREAQRRDYLNREKEGKKTDAFLGKLSLSDTADWPVPDKNYSIYIPKIFANSKVIADVNAADSKVYLPALKQGVAEAAGLSHPGQIGTTFLFAHSVGSRVDFARYNAVFYLLDKLTFGDKIEIMYRGKLFKYEVVEREILPADDVKYLTPQSLSEKLVMQTCYPPGTTWKRLIVTAKRI